MARLINDLMSVGKAIWNASSDNSRMMYVGYGLPLIVQASRGVLALTNTAGHKLVRWIGRDQTNYVDWYDLEGQINRLATDRMSEIRGALAPSAIYDRKVVDMLSMITPLAILYKNLSTNGTYIVGTSALLALAAHSLYECHQYGDQLDPTLNDMCWDHLGSLRQEPNMLAALALLYTASKGKILISIGLVGTVASLFVANSLANGYEGRIWPTALRQKDTLLYERYKALTAELNKQWKEAQDKDPETKANIIKTAELLNRRSRLISSSLEETMNVNKTEGESIVKPLIQAAELILKETNNKTLQ